MENTRIDKGIKRKARSEARSNPLVKKHWTKHDPEIKAKAIAEVAPTIQAGGIPKDVADKYDIPLSTLHSWIISSDDVEIARGLMLASELMQRAEKIDTAGDALELACAREGFRAWSWIAERREHRLYGQRQHIELESQPLSSVDRQLLGSAQELLSMFKQRYETVVKERQIAVQHDIPALPSISVSSQVIDK